MCVSECASECECECEKGTIPRGNDMSAYQTFAGTGDASSIPSHVGMVDDAADASY